MRSKIGQCDAQSLSNLAWCFGTLLIQPGPLICAIAEASSRCLHTFDAQDSGSTSEHVMASFLGGH